MQKPISLKELIFGIFIVFAGLPMVIAAIFWLWTILSSKTWPVTRGEVIYINIVKEIPSQEWPSGSYLPVIKYHYILSGIEYSHTMILFPTSSEKKINDLQNKYAVGSQINVFCDPERPRGCISEDEVSMYTKLSVPVLLIGVIFITVGSLLVWDNVPNHIRKFIKNR